MLKEFNRLVLEEGTSLSLSPSLVAISIVTCLDDSSGGNIWIFGDVSVNLSVSLRPLQVDATLLCKLLVATLHEFGEPALRVRHRPRILWVKVLGHLWLPLALHWNVDLGTAVDILHINVIGLLYFLAHGHSLFNKLLEQVLLVLITTFG